MSMNKTSQNYNLSVFGYPRVTSAVHECRSVICCNCVQVWKLAHRGSHWQLQAVADEWSAALMNNRVLSKNGTGAIVSAHKTLTF